VPAAEALSLPLLTVVVAVAAFVPVDAETLTAPPAVAVPVEAPAET
jgi:hypothetical protein